MSFIKLPWARQPFNTVGVEHGNPLAKNIAGAWLPTGGGAVDAARRIGRLTATNATQEPNLLGIVHRFNGSSAFLTNTSQSLATAPPLTFNVWVRLNTVKVSRIFDVSTGTTANTVIGVYCGGAGGVNLIAQHYDGTNNREATYTNGTTAIGGKWSMLTGVFEGLSSRRLYVNGAEVASSTTTANSTTGVNRVTLGYAPWSGSEYFDGLMVAPMLWSRALTQAEIAALYVNAWQVFQPRKIWVPVEIAGGGTNLTAQDATHAHAADAVTLTSDSTLAVADAAHAHAADSPALTSSTALTVADAAHAHSADNLDLTVNGSTDLLVDDALHAHTADNAELSGDGIEVATERRRGGSRFAIARKALLKRQLIEWLTKEEPSEEVKTAVQEVKAGVPVETTEAAKPEPKIDPEELAKKLIPRRLIGLDDILTRSQLRVVRRAAQIAQERDDEDILMLL